MLRMGIDDSAVLLAGQWGKLNAVTVAVDTSKEAKWALRARELALDLSNDKTAKILWSLFDRLDDYSCTYPSMTTIGKFWKAHTPYSGRGTWWLGQYALHPTDPENRVSIIWRELFIITPMCDCKRATDDLIDSLRAAQALAI